MRGKRVLVTGGTGGIGMETARGLARLGAHVIVVGRDARRAEDGVEKTFAVNVLAPFTLTRSLVPLLGAGAPARVINITGGIPRGPIDLGDLQGEKRYLGWTFSQYNHTKVIMMAMSLTLAERVAGSGITVNVAYPGHASTPGNRALPVRAFPLAYRPVAPLVRLLGPVLLADVGKAARSSVHLASSPRWRASPAGTSTPTAGPPPGRPRPWTSATGRPSGSCARG